MNKPIPLDPARRLARRRPLPQPDPDFHAAVLERLAQLSDALDDLAEVVIADAARRNRSP